MTNQITEIEVESTSGEMVSHVIIDNGDGSKTSMLKSTWDELKAQWEQGGTL
jgi:hypothetical protein